MDELKHMVVFSHVVETGSFTAAARRLGIAKSAISKHVSTLEERIGARLLNRTTRRLSLTDIGEKYYQSCRKLTEALTEAKQCVTSLQEKPRGTLKVSCPASFGISHITPLLHEFLQQFPSLNAELLLDDNVLDMTEHGIDVAIRVGWLHDSSLRAKKLTDAPRLLCASPAYLERMGVPKKPEDLVAHDWIIFSLLPTPYKFTFTRRKKATSIHVKGRIKINNGSAVHTLLLAGAGIAALSDFLVSVDIERGNLIQLLPDYQIAEAGIYAVYHEQRLQQVKIRKFIDFLARKFSN
jgi:DNA-binding transcriptional LysR family regulator